VVRLPHTPTSYLRNVHMPRMNNRGQQSSDSRASPSCLSRVFHACLFRICLLLWTLGSFPAFSAPLNVTVVVSDDSAPYAEIADYIASDLKQNGAGRSRTIGAEALARMDRSGTDVVVAVGLKATQAVAAMDLRAPVISTLIPKASFEKIARQLKNKPNQQYFSAVYLDQPVARQLELMCLVLPDKKRVGVILGPTSEGLLESLQTETRARGMQLHAVHIGSEAELFPALQNLFNEADVLLSLPDPLVFSAQTIQSVLFTSYRFQIPVIGFSPAYVRAGALIAVHSTPVQLARQVMEMLHRFASGTSSLPPPQYPEYFSVTVNRQVARSLGFTIGEEEKLATQLEARRLGP